MTTRTERTCADVCRAGLAGGGVLALVVALWCAGTASADPGDTVLVSRASGVEGAKGNRRSFLPVLSGDGRVVAFDSEASNLAPDDPDTFRDAFVRDLATDQTAAVSRPTPAGSEAVGGALPSVSADGRFVAFSSDRADADEVYVRDLMSGDVVLASRASGAIGGVANGDSTNPSISADGRFVAFASLATNLSPDDHDDRDDVYVRDLLTGRTALATRANGLAGRKARASESQAHQPVISPNGRFVAFGTDARNLSGSDHDRRQDLYVRDLRTGRTTLASRGTGAAGRKGNGDSGSSIAFSSDGRFVAFESNATNLAASDRDRKIDIFVRDLQRRRTTLVSRASGKSGAKANATSDCATCVGLSADGRYVAFASNGSNLTRDDTDHRSDVFVRDMRARTTTLASRATGISGAKAVGISGFGVAISRDGRFVAFDTSATNLSACGRPPSASQYVRQLR